MHFIGQGMHPLIIILMNALHSFGLLSELRGTAGGVETLHIRR
jgi:hypothetical protein